jgi:excisionase family DNA binding protein
MITTNIETQFKRIIREAIEETLPQILRKSPKSTFRKTFLTVAEAVQMSGLSERQIRYLVEKRQISFHQPGRKIAISADSLENYLEKIRVEEVSK